MVKRKENITITKDYDSVIESLFVIPKKSDKIITPEEFDVEDYSDVMYPIEFTIASYYVEHTNLTDKKLEKTITSILKIHDKPKASPSKKTTNKVTSKPTPEKTKDTLSIRLKKAIIHTLKQRPLSREEIFFCFEYILYSIDNRTWIPGNQGYLDWIANMFDLLVGKKKQKFDYMYEDLAQTIGIESDFLKGNIPDDVEIIVDEEGLKEWENRIN